MIVRCQYRFISFNKYITPVGDVVNGGGMHVLGQVVYENSVSSIEFCYKSQTALKGL